MEAKEILRTGKSKALYVQIKEFYRNKILNGQLCIGDRLDSETEIQKRFGVSRITARQAVLDLEKEGMVHRGRGKGTFVTWQAQTPSVWQTCFDYRQDLAPFAKGKLEQTISLSREPVGPLTSSVLGIATPHAMYCARRIFSDETGVLCFVLSCYPEHFSLIPSQSIEEDKLQRQLLEESEYIPVLMEEEISSSMPDEQLCSVLKTQKDQPLLVKKRIFYNASSQPVEYTLAFYPGSRYAWRRSTKKDD